MLLIGDTGGTKTSLAVVSKESGPRHFLAEATFLNGQFPSLEAIVKEFLKDINLAVDGAVFGVAGPVLKNRAKLTNLPWILDVHELQKTFHFSYVRILNDLEAIAHAIPILERSELFTLNKGVSVNKGNIAVVAPGAGLGEAFLTWDHGKRYQVHSSEGGHADFAPNSRLETNLMNYLRESFDHVSYERVCSGPGISNIYSYLRQEGYGNEPLWLTERLAEADDITPVIVNAALDEGIPCKICVKTLDEFVSVLGAEAGNLALKTLATKGVYIGGGIPPRILPFFKKGSFMNLFRSKGRYSGFMDRIPVHIILNTKVALLGAACKALEN